VANIGRLYEVAERQREALLLGERDASSQLVQQFGGMWQRLRREIDELLEKRAKAEAAGEIIGPEWLYRQNRLESLVAQVERELRLYAEFADPVVTRAQGQAIDAALWHSEELVRAATRQVGLSVNWNSLPIDPLRSLIGFTSNGSPLRELFDSMGLEVSQLMRDGLIQGVAMGWNPERIARQLRDYFARGLTQSLTTCRTEVMRAYREGSRASYLENDDILEGWVWNAACTPRTCAMCVTGDTVVSGPLPQKVFARHYTGDIVIIQTASGKHLSVTPNHPILTGHGWVKAGLLKKGDNVVSSTDSDGAALCIGIDDYQVPTLIREVAETFGMVTAKVESASPYFHGDGAGSQVYVVRSNGLLGDYLPPLTEQQIVEQIFTLRSSGVQTPGSFVFPKLSSLTTFLPSFLIRLRMILENLFPFSQRNFGATNGLGFLSSPAPGVRYAQTSGNGKSVDIEGFSERVFALSGQIASGNLNIRQLQGRVPRSSVFTASKSVPLFFGAQQSTFPEDGSKTFPTDTELGRDLLGSLTGKVGLDRVLKVDVRRFSGHVYNLQTESGWYSSNGIITHNCWAMHGTTHPLTERLDDHPNGRCVMLPKVKAVKGLSPQWLPESGEAQFKRLDPATQANILGPLYELYETGQIGLADVVGRKFDGDWGSMRFVRSKKSITEGMG
jgi:hypothetical protein